MEVTETWYTRRDALLEQLSDLLSELQVHDEGSGSESMLLDHLDGTRRALDRFAAILSDKYSHPSTLNDFSPSVSRPISVSTTSSASDSTSKSSLDSYPSIESSPTTIISEEGQHRQSLLDEDDDDVLIGRRELLDSINEDADEGDAGNEDADERFERLSMLLTSVLKEAHAAISIPAESELDTVHEILDEDDSDNELNVANSLSTDKSLFTKTLDVPFEPIPSISPTDLLVEQCTIPSLSIPKTPYSSLSRRRKLRAPRPSVDDLFVSHATVSTTCEEVLVTPTPADITTKPTFVQLPIRDADLNIKDHQLAIKIADPLPTASLLEISLDSILGDYFSEVMTDMQQSDVIGLRFWIVMVGVAFMWLFQWVTDGLVRGLVCRC